MTQEPPAPQYDPQGLSERAALRTIRERRGRIIRTILKVLVVVVLMSVLLILNRDNQAQRGCRTRMEALAARLQALEQSEDDNPLRLLLSGARGEAPEIRSQLGHMYTNAFYHAQAASRGRAGVCCCRESHARILLPSGRHVLVYDADDRSYEIVWMEEAEFDAAADALGFRGLSPHGGAHP